VGVSFPFHLHRACTRTSTEGPGEPDNETSVEVPEEANDSVDASDETPVADSEPSSSMDEPAPRREPSPEPEPSPVARPTIEISEPVYETPKQKSPSTTPSASFNSSAKKPPSPATRSTPKAFPAPGKGLNKVWEEIPTVNTDKVNALMLSASAHKWEVVVTIHEPGKPLMSTLSSRVPPKQARLVMTELRTRMRASINGEEAPTLDAVLVAGMRELAALEEEDMAELLYPPDALASKQAVVEVLCHTDFKTQVTYRIKGAISDWQATALCSSLRRLKNLQKSAVSPHDPVSSTLAAAVIAGLLTWDRDL
jgi:hypothetical protein